MWLLSLKHKTDFSKPVFLFYRITTHVITWNTYLCVMSRDQTDLSYGGFGAHQYFTKMWKIFNLDIQTRVSINICTVLPGNPNGCMGLQHKPLSQFLRTESVQKYADIHSQHCLQWSQFVRGTVHLENEIFLDNTEATVPFISFLIKPLRLSALSIYSVIFFLKWVLKPLSTAWSWREIWHTFRSHLRFQGLQ